MWLVVIFSLVKILMRMNSLFMAKYTICYRVLSPEVQNQRKIMPELNFMCIQV